MLITAGDRQDAILAVALAELAGIKPAGLLLSSGLMPDAELLAFCQPAMKAGLPILLSDEDTLALSQRLLLESWPIAPDDRERGELTKHVVAKHIDLGWIDDMRYAARKRRLTPPAFRYKLIEAARAAQKRIVLPEGERTRTIMAARICARKGIARPVLIGNPQRIAAVAQSQGLN